MACLLVGACGGQADEPTGPAPPTGPPPASPTRGTPAPSLAPSVKPSLAPTLTPAPGRTIGPSGPVTVRGTVEEGVEAGCLLLRGYLLIGGREHGIRAGATVTVTGQVQPDLVSTCQQGTPLRVDTVRPG